jgi:ABC-type Fe2+-enterobactin transport system substrate-binding protein
MCLANRRKALRVRRSALGETKGFCGSCDRASGRDRAVTAKHEKTAKRLVRGAVTLTAYLTALDRRVPISASAVTRSAARYGVLADRADRPPST